MAQEKATFKNFSYEQLRRTEGFKQKVCRIFHESYEAEAAFLDINYIDTKNEEIFIFAIDTAWHSYYFKVQCKGFSKRISEKLHLEILYADISETENLLEKMKLIEGKQADKPESMTQRIREELDLAMQYITVNTDFNIESTGNNSVYNIDLRSFYYKDLKDIVEPRVKELLEAEGISEMFQFKIFTREVNTLEVLAITSNPIKLYQMNFYIDKKIFSAIWNRYINCLPFDEKSIEIKKRISKSRENLSIRELPKEEKGLYSVIQNLNYDNDNKIEVKVSWFAKFLFKRTMSKVQPIELKNVCMFLTETASSKQQQSSNIVGAYIRVPTCEEKEYLEREAKE